MLKEIIESRLARVDRPAIADFKSAIVDALTAEDRYEFGEFEISVAPKEGEITIRYQGERRAEFSVYFENGGEAWFGATYFLKSATAESPGYAVLIDEEGEGQVVEAKALVLGEDGYVRSSPIDLSELLDNSELETETQKLAAECFLVQEGRMGLDFAATLYRLGGIITRGGQGASGRLKECQGRPAAFAPTETF